MINYKEKYFKYKNKYFIEKNILKNNQQGGANSITSFSYSSLKDMTEDDAIKLIANITTNFDINDRETDRILGAIASKFRNSKNVMIKILVIDGIYLTLTQNDELWSDTELVLMAIKSESQLFNTARDTLLVNIQFIYAAIKINVLVFKDIKEIFKTNINILLHAIKHGFKDFDKEFIALEVINNYITNDLKDLTIATIDILYIKLFNSKLQILDFEGSAKIITIFEIKTDDDNIIVIINNLAGNTIDIKITKDTTFNDLANKYGELEVYSENPGDIKFLYNLELYGLEHFNTKVFTLHPNTPHTPQN